MPCDGCCSHSGLPCALQLDRALPPAAAGAFHADAGSLRETGIVRFVQTRDSTPNSATIGPPPNDRTIRKAGTPARGFRPLPSVADAV